MRAALRPRANLYAPSTPRRARQTSLGAKTRMTTGGTAGWKWFKQPCLGRRTFHGWSDLYDLQAVRTPALVTRSLVLRSFSAADDNIPREDVDSRSVPLSNGCWSEARNGYERAQEEAVQHHAYCGGRVAQMRVLVSLTSYRCHLHALMSGSVVYHARWAFSLRLVRKPLAGQVAWSPARRVRLVLSLRKIEG
jgi:hypothetical protein